MIELGVLLALIVIENLTCVRREHERHVPAMQRGGFGRRTPKMPGRQNANRPRPERRYVLLQVAELASFPLHHLL